MARLRLITDQIREFEAARAARIDHAPTQGANAMVLLLARVVGVGLETADMLVHEIPSRGLRDRGRWRATPASPGHRTRALI
jgi:transposase